MSHLDDDVTTEVVSWVRFEYPGALGQYVREALASHGPVVHVVKGDDRWYIEVTR